MILRNLLVCVSRRQKDFKSAKSRDNLLRFAILLHFSAVAAAEPLVATMHVASLETMSMGILERMLVSVCCRGDSRMLE